MADSEKESKKSTVGSVLGRFFITITLGGLFLSFGLISLIKWIRHQPSPISIELAIASFALGVGLDVWAVLHFWRRRHEVYDQLK